MQCWDSSTCTQTTCCQQLQASPRTSATSVRTQTHRGPGLESTCPSPGLKYENLLLPRTLAVLVLVTRNCLEKAGKLALSESAPDKQRIICKTAIAQNIIPISSPESYNRRPEIVPRSAEPGSATIPDARKAHLHQLPSLQPRNEELAQRGFIKQRLPHAMRVTHTANLFKWFFATVVERW